MTADLRTLPPHRQVRLARPAELPDVHALTADGAIRAALARLDAQPTARRDEVLVRLVELVHQTAAALSMLGHTRAAAGLRRDLERMGII